MVEPDGSLSFYFFDIDDNLLFLPTNLYLWNTERQIEQAISSGEFAAIQNDIGRKGNGRRGRSANRPFATSGIAASPSRTRSLSRT
jgi:hypothetical protein